MPSIHLESLSPFGRLAVKLDNDFVELARPHEQSTAAAKLVEERAQVVHKRKQQQNELQEKLAHLEKCARAANTGFADFRKNGISVSSEDEKAQLKIELEKLHRQIAGFIETAQAIKEDAAQLKFKGVEREAESILSTLKSSRRKISNVL